MRTAAMDVRVVTASTRQARIPAEERRKTARAARSMATQPVGAGLSETAVPAPATADHLMTFVAWDASAAAVLLASLPTVPVAPTMGIPLAMVGQPANAARAQVTVAPMPPTAPQIAYQVPVRAEVARSTSIPAYTRNQTTHWAAIRPVLSSSRRRDCRLRQPFRRRPRRIPGT